jgi:predicted Rossmann-fold nucleotide-binding protein
MSRKPIVAVIGGNGLPDVAASALRFGAVLSNQAILLTGGAPDGPRTDVKSAAMFGSQGAMGLMISVLPKVGPSCELPPERRLVLKTGLGSYERDPITGSAGDVVVAFSGGAGTLVELAYAAFQKRPIIFQSSIEYLRVKCSFEATEVRLGLEKTVKGYPLISANKDELEHALIGCLSNPRAVCADTPEGAVRALFSSIDQGAGLGAETNFLGLPGNDTKHWKNKFNEGVARLSKL